MLAGWQAAAIAAAELVHRDIKHVSIILSGGQAKVPGFGIVRAEGAAAVAGAVAVPGAAACLSPEQASGRPGGPRADVPADSPGARPSALASQAVEWLPVVP